MGQSFGERFEGLGEIAGRDRCGSFAGPFKYFFEDLMELWSEVVSCQG